MELLWIFLLIFNGFVANATEPDCYKELCSKQCVMFSVPLVVCAPNVSNVTVTPYYDYPTVPQFKNLLCNGRSVSLCDLLCQGAPYKIECCKPKPWMEPSKPVYHPTNSIPAQAATPAINDEPQIDLEVSVMPDGTKTPAVNPEIESPLLKGLIYPSPPKKPPPYNLPPTKPPPCKEPPTKPPPCVEPEPPKPPCKPCCIPQNAPPPSFVYPDFGCECYPPLCVNPRYHCELSSLYGSSNNAPLVPYNQNNFNPIDQGNFGQRPNGQPQFFNFNRDCMNRFCCPYPPPPPPPKTELIPNYIRGIPHNTYQQPDKTQSPPYSNVDILHKSEEVKPPSPAIPESTPSNIKHNPLYDVDFTKYEYTVPDTMSSPVKTENTDRQIVMNINTGSGEVNAATEMQQVVQNSEGGGGGGGYLGDKSDITAGNSKPATSEPTTKPDKDERF